jgi:hypothetical protein
MFCVRVFMILVLARSIVKCIFCCFLFSIWNFVLLKIVFRKKMVDLKSCDIANSLPNSSLTYNTRGVGELAIASKGSLSNLRR